MQLVNKRLVIIISAALSLLLIPFIAMKFTNEVVWTPIDFATMGFLLLCTAIGIELALRITKGTLIKVAAVAAVLFAFVMIWGTLVHMGG